MNDPWDQNLKMYVSNRYERYWLGHVIFQQKLLRYAIRSLLCFRHFYPNWWGSMLNFFTGVLHLMQRLFESIQLLASLLETAQRMFKSRVSPLLWRRASRSSSRRMLSIVTRLSSLTPISSTLNDFPRRMSIKSFLDHTYLSAMDLDSASVRFLFMYTMVANGPYLWA